MLDTYRVNPMLSWLILRIENPNFKRQFKHARRVHSGRLVPDYYSGLKTFLQKM
jgi:hypothetical protein